MNSCDGCKWWSELVAQQIGDGPMTAMCLNTQSPDCQKMVWRGCDEREFGTAIDCPVR